MRQISIFRCFVLAVAAVSLACLPAAAQDSAVADAVVVVDTSTSMHDPGMDPERASLLVTKLLADIVPGDLAVVRLLDLQGDEKDLPSRETGETMPCAEDPSQTCNRVEPVGDWQAAARSRKLGALIRAARGDAAYKQELEGHLEQKTNSSMFFLAFRAVQGIFGEHKSGGSKGVPRTARKARKNMLLLVFCSRCPSSSCL